MTSTPNGDTEQAPARERDAFRERTVLLGSFAAQDLEPDGDHETAGPSAALQDFLLDECTRVSTPLGRRWRMAEGSRTLTLERLRTRKRLLAAARNAPRGDDPACAWAERLLRGGNPPLEEQSFEELYTALTVVGWFRDAPLSRKALVHDGVRLPDLNDLESAVKRARLFQPLHALADARFTGRTTELAALDAIFDGAPDTSDSAPVPASALSVGSQELSTWAFVHGPGGVGKSTLLARFVLDRLDGRRSAPVDSQAPSQDRERPGPSPCFYLTFDRHDLVAERPLTLVAESVRQLGLLRPDLAGRTAELERELEITLSADRFTRSEDSHHGPRAAHQRDELTLIDAFAALVASITGGTDVSQPWLLALDAFEQVQRGGPVALRRLLDFLDGLRRAHPGLRVLAAGRVPVAEPAFRPLRLDGFDAVTARTFLRRELADAPSAPPAHDQATADDRDIEEIIGIVGTSPLNLQLAAVLVRREGVSFLGEGDLPAELRLKLSAETVQGVLYRRLLDHFHDPDLRRIASPGLVVRVLTPDVIREVLAVPCGLGRLDEDRARRMYYAFRAEATLVEDVPGQEAVVHRGDVRRAMLPLLRRDHQTVVERIHRKAVHYYAQRDAHTDPVASRVEELYHRLALGQSTRTLDGRWIEDAGPLLEPAIEELPASAQVYLIEKLGGSASDELRAAGDDEVWERQALRIGKALLAADDPAGVTDLLRERPHRVSGNLGLTALSMRAALALRRPVDAYDLVGRAMDLAADTADPEVFVELTLLGARSCEDLGRFEEALNLLDRARRIADEPGMDTRLLSVAAAQLRIHRRSGAAATAEATALRADTVRRVNALSSKAFRRHPQLIRELAAEIGDELPHLVSYTARSLGVGGTEGADDALLGSLTGEVGVVPRVPASTAGTISVSSVSRGNAVGDYLDTHADTAEPLSEALVDTYRHELDRPYTGDAVVVLPGFAGSALMDRETDEAVWGAGVASQQLLTPAGLFRDLARLRVTAAERAGGLVMLRPTGLLQEVAWLPLVGGLSPYGALVKGVNASVLHDRAVLEFPYDWRLSVAAAARHLAKAALRHLAQWRDHPKRRASILSQVGEGPKLVLVAHAMGGLVAQAALAEFPELARATREVVTIGTPFHGVPKIMQFLDPFGSSPRHVSMARPLAEAARSMPGLYDLLPDTHCVYAGRGGMRRLALRDVEEVGGDGALAADAFEARLRRHAAVGRLPRWHAIVGTSQPTAQSMSIEGGRVRLLPLTTKVDGEGNFVRDEDDRLIAVQGGGDGLVPLESAIPSGFAGCLPVVGQHSSLLTSSTVVNLVQEIVSGKPAPRTFPLSQEAGLRPMSFGISAPPEVTPGDQWTLTITGADHAALSCSLVRATTGEVTARIRTAPVEGQPGTSTARTTVREPGIYEVVARAGGLSATALVVAVQYATPG
ncbi:lipase/acyltransferase domain-containing protein [Streptomyces sp. NBC_00391]|uniref:lipase/acyltransferase domain-containing protein n=1 Tax=Streptomyces sp. NBC_00391 TaxID=2903647 RepID=UPI002E1ABEA7